MANSASHAALPFPIKGARFTVQVPYLNSSGVPTDPVTPDTEVAKDGGAFADCTEEVTTIAGANGFGFITLTGDETNCSMLALAAKVASGPNATLMEIRPQLLHVMHSGTAQAGAGGSITLASGASTINGAYQGLIIRTTGGTGGAGGSGSQNNQARIITAYNGSTKVATVVPNWEVNPDNTTTYEVQRSYPVGLISADVRAINTVEGDAPLLAGNVEGDVIGTISTAVNGAGSATTFSCSDITEATTNHYLGKQVSVISGTLKGQWLGVVISDALANGEHIFTVSPGSPTAETMVSSDKVCIGS